MSRLDDLIDLIQTANEIYLINPDRNVRTAFIQIDDLCELALKSYLQANVTDWTPISHQHSERTYFKGFPTILDEVRTQFDADRRIQDLLDGFQERRENRNRFFHNQEQTGLTVTNENCLRAFCDLYRLMTLLFPDFPTKVLARPIARAQIAAIKLKLAACGFPQLNTLYEEMLRQGWREFSLSYNALGHEYCTLHSDAYSFYEAIISAFEGAIHACNAEIERIDGLKRPRQRHQQQKLILQGRVQKLEHHLSNLHSP